MDWKDLTLGLGVAVGLALVLVSSLARGSLSWASVRLNALIGAYLVWAMLGIIYSHYRYATVSELARLAAHVGLYWLVILAVREARQVRQIVGAAALAAAPVCIYSFMQAAGADPVQWATSGVRVFSSLGNPTYLAGYLVLLIPLVLAAGWPAKAAKEDSERPRRGRTKWAAVAFLLVVAAMMVVSLFLTVSRAPIAGIVIGGGIAALLALIRHGRKAHRMVFAAIAVGLIAFIGIGYLSYRRLPRGDQKRIQSALRLHDSQSKERTLIQLVGLDIFRKRPLLGEAYGTYGIYALERLAPTWYADLGKSTDTMLVPNYAHNELVEVLAETGVVGGLLFLALVATACAGAVGISLHHPEPEWERLGLAITVGIAAFLVQNWFGVTFRQTGPVTFFWLSLGLLAVGQSRMRSAVSDSPQPALRQYRFTPPSLPALVAIGVGLAAALAALSWVAVRPVMSNVLVQRAEREAKLRRFESAGRLADRAIELNPYSTLAYYTSAYAWGSLGDHKRSLNSNKKALALLPGNASVYYNLGINYKELGRIEEARDSFRRAIELMPTAMPHHAAMAETLIQLGRYDDALSYAEAAARLEPTNPNVHMLLADIKARRGDPTGTAAEMENAARLAPGNASVLSQLAQLYFRLNNPAKAADVALRWLKTDPRAFDAYIMLGACRYNQGDYAGSRAALQKAVELQPNNPGARLRLAYACARLKQFSDAQREFEWLVSRYPDTPEGKAAAGFLHPGATRSPGQP